MKKTNVSERHRIINFGSSTILLLASVILSYSNYSVIYIQLSNHLCYDLAVLVYTCFIYFVYYKIIVGFLSVTFLSSSKFWLWTTWNSFQFLSHCIHWWTQVYSFIVSLFYISWFMLCFFTPDIIYYQCSNLLRASCFV